MPDLSLPDGSCFTDTLERLLPRLERRVVRLRLIDSTHFHVRHEPVLHGLLCQMFGHDLPEVMPAAVESGRTVFRPGDGYAFGLTLLGDASRDLPRALDRLVAVGQRTSSRHEGRTLWGNFRVERVEQLDSLGPHSVTAAAHTLAAHGEAVLHFLSPLELRRPRGRGQRKRPPGHFDTAYFPAAAFLARCWRRFADLRGDRPGPVPDIPAGARADPGDLLWLDVPTRGAPGGKAGRPRGQTKGGVIGRVTLAGLTPDWCALLALLRHLHVGQGVRYGFGRFRLPGTPGTEEVFRPARCGFETAESCTHHG